MSGLERSCLTLLMATLGIAFNGCVDPNAAFEAQKEVEAEKAEQAAAAAAEREAKANEPLTKIPGAPRSPNLQVKGYLSIDRGVHKDFFAAYAKRDELSGLSILLTSNQVDESLLNEDWLFIDSAAQSGNPFNDGFLSGLMLNVDEQTGVVKSWTLWHQGVKIRVSGSREPIKDFRVAEHQLSGGIEIEQDVDGTQIQAYADFAAGVRK